MQRRAWGIAAIAAAVVGAGALIVTAPAPYLIDVPAFAGEINNLPGTGQTVTPELSEFYDVDPSTVPATPGALMDAEPIPGGPPGVEVHRIMYASTDLQGNPLPVSGLFAYPTGDPPEGGWPLIGYAHGTTGVGRACGMSQAPFTEETPGFAHFWLQILPMVERGWAVVASDLSGMGAPGPGSYLVGPLEGRNVLDSMRAVLTPDDRIGSVPLDADQLGVYGTSQGGSTTLSTLQEAVTYAPELDLKGGMALALGLIVPIPGALELVASNPTSTMQNMFMLLIAKSYADSYPDLVDIEDVLTPVGIEHLALLDEYCGQDLATRVVDVPLSELVRTPLDSGLLAAMERAMPQPVPLGAPAIIAQGLADVTILPAFTHAQVMTSCAVGERVWYDVYPDDDHYTIRFQARESGGRIYDWMQARFDGVPAPTNCANQLGLFGSAGAG